MTPEEAPKVDSVQDIIDLEDKVIELQCILSNVNSGSKAVANRDYYGTLHVNCSVLLKTLSSYTTELQLFLDATIAKPLAEEKIAYVNGAFVENAVFTLTAYNLAGDIVHYEETSDLHTAMKIAETWNAPHATTRLHYMRCPGCSSLLQRYGEVWSHGEVHNAIDCPFYDTTQEVSSCLCSECTELEKGKTVLCARELPLL